MSAVERYSLPGTQDAFSYAVAAIAVIASYVIGKVFLAGDPLVTTVLGVAIVIGMAFLMRARFEISEGEITVREHGYLGRARKFKRSHLSGVRVATNGSYPQLELVLRDQTVVIGPWRGLPFRRQRQVLELVQSRLTRGEG